MPYPSRFFMAERTAKRARYVGPFLRHAFWNYGERQMNSVKCCFPLGRKHGSLPALLPLESLQGGGGGHHRDHGAIEQPLGPHLLHRRLSGTEAKAKRGSPLLPRPCREILVRSLLLKPLEPSPNLHKLRVPLGGRFKYPKEGSSARSVMLGGLAGTYWETTFPE